MSLAQYPMWVYRQGEGGAVEPRFVRDAAARAALGVEWTETPDGRPEVEGAGIQAKVRPAGQASPSPVVFQPYPKMIYRRVATGAVPETRVLHSEADEAEAAAAGGWSEDLDGREPLGAPQGGVSAPAVPSETQGPTTTQGGSPQTLQAAVHGASVADLGVTIETLRDAGDRGALEQLRAFEVDHPKYPGGRKTVLQMIDAALAPGA